jgi:hypothetical protein
MKQEQVKERLRELQCLWVMATNDLLRVCYDEKLHSELVETLENPIK